MTNRQGLGNVGDIGSYLDSVQAVVNTGASQQNLTTNPESTFASIFATNPAANITVSGKYVVGGGPITMSALDLYYQLGPNPQLYETYTENYPSSVPTDVTLADVAAYYENGVSTSTVTGNGGTVAFPSTDPEAVKINAWWNAILATPGFPSHGQMSILSLSDVMRILQTPFGSPPKQYLTFSTSPTNSTQLVAPSALPSDAAFQAEMAIFIQQYNKTGIQPPSPTNFAQSFVNFLGNDANFPPGYSLHVPVVFQSSDGTASFTLPPGNDPSTFAGITLPQGVANTLSATSVNPLIDAQSLVAVLKAQFITQLSAGSSTPSSANDPNDWFTQLNTNEQDALFQNTFTTFATYLTSPNTTLSLGDNFLQDWSNYIGPLALLSNGATGDVPGTTVPLSSLATYENIWNAYFPHEATNSTAGAQPFLNAISSFINTHFLTTSGFTPSAYVGEWLKSLRTATIGQYGGQMLTGANFDEVQIIFKIYDLLIQVLGNLQTMAVSQLNRQSFYQKLQAAYTSLEQGLTANLVVGSNGALSGYGSANSPQGNNVSRRSDVSQLTSQFAESIRSFRSEIQDIGTQQNTAVSQTQQSVSQQLNVAQTLIQQFSTLMQSIWR